MIGGLLAADRDRWGELWRQYLDFYETELPPATFDYTWARLLVGREVRGLAAREAGEIVGIVHFLFHPSAWTTTPVVYLQDLFTDPARRGRGVARGLIEAVAAAAGEAGSTRVYWMTKADNAVARGLYDRVARHSGFIRYEMSPLRG